MLMGANVAAQSTAPVERGAALPRQWCAECHATDEAQATDAAPPFVGAARRRSPDYLRGFLANPHSRATMPTFDNLTVAQIEDLVAYLQSLK